MNNCQVFTPNYIVELMLDNIGYCGDNIKDKTILEPSFGDGAFLTAIVKRIINYASKHNLNNKTIYQIFDNIYGIEIDKKYYDITIKKLNDIIKPYGLEYEWKHLSCSDTLKHDFNMLFDFCVTNPPYTKIHHLTQETREIIAKRCEFCSGNTDLYIAFFEICSKLLKEDGKLCFISPNSYFRNNSQVSFRDFLIKNSLVKSIIDFSNVKVFGSIATYPAIILLDKSNKSNIINYTLMKNETEKEFQTSVDLSPFKSKQWVFTNNDDATFLTLNSTKQQKLKDICDIQYGIATNADKVYIVNDCKKFEEGILRPVIKASTLNSDNYILFPYKWNTVSSRYEVIEEREMKSLFPKTYNYFIENHNILIKRDMDTNFSTWYQFARSQGIQNSNKKKIVLKHIISPHKNTCEYKEVSSETLVYSGIYIIVKSDKDYDFVKEIISSEEFHRYLFLVGKNMAGGYKSVNTKLIKEYGIDEP